MRFHIISNSPDINLGVNKKSKEIRNFLGEENRRMSDPGMNNMKVVSLTPKITHSSVFPDLENCTRLIKIEKSEYDDESRSVR